MKNLIYLFFFLLGSSIGFSQIVDGHFIVTNNDGSTYSVKIQIKLQSGSQALDNGTIRFSFNNTANGLSFPSTPVEGVNYIFHNFQGGDYTSSVSRPSANVVAVNIARTSGSGTTIGTSYIDVATINFDILNESGNSNLVWTIRELFSPGGFTPWILGSWPNEDTQPLPVELSSFTARINANLVNLKWQTKTEVDNYGFEIERASLNPKSDLSAEASAKAEIRNPKFVKIGFIPGSGNSNSPKDYSFADNNPSGGSRFLYRLKQVDTDGKFQYSEEVAVDFIPEKFVLFQNYPNPFNPVTNIKFAVPKAGNITLSVYSILGEKVKDLVSGFYEPGIYNFEFNAKDLGSGTYIYRMQGENFVQVKKMILLK